MKFNKKDYELSKVKKYFKKHKIFFFFNGINRNSLDWVKTTEQSLKTKNFDYYKNFNKTTIKTLKNSKYSNFKALINASTFLIKPKNKKLLLKTNIISNFKSLLFILLAIKFNNKIYSLTTLKNIYSLKYTENKLMLYQFLITNIKPSVRIFEIM